MFSRQAITHALRVVGITLAGSLLMALFLVWWNRPTMPIGMALAGYATAFGGPMLGLSLGGQLALELRRGAKQWHLIWAYLALAATLLTIAYVIGSQTPPIVGRSESGGLFPGWCLVGLLAGSLSVNLRFRPDRKARERRSYAIEIKFSGSANPEAMKTFRAWLHERHGVALDGEPRIHFTGLNNLRAGIAEIREALQRHSLTDRANIVRSEG